MKYCAKCVNESSTTSFVFIASTDASISLDEYMTYKCSSFAQLEGRPMSKFEAQFEALQFRRFDEDGNGTIDYNEFLKSEACKYLMRRPVVRPGPVFYLRLRKASTKTLHMMSVQST